MDLVQLPDKPLYTDRKGFLKKKNRDRVGGTNWPCHVLIALPEMFWTKFRVLLTCPSISHAPCSCFRNEENKLSTAFVLCILSSPGIRNAFLLLFNILPKWNDFLFPWHHMTTLKMALCLLFIALLAKWNMEFYHSFTKCKKLNIVLQCVFRPATLLEDSII